MFVGHLVELKDFGGNICFSSVHDNSSWSMVTVYGPCQGPRRDEFVQWLYNLQIPPNDNWLLLGDFNFIQLQEN